MAALYIGLSDLLRSRHRLSAGLWAVVSVLLFGSAATAQNHYQGNVTMGVRAGADMSQVMFHPTVSQQFKPGVTAGVTFRYIEENHFGVIAELDFTQKGWKEKFDQGNYAYGRTLNYIELPVMTHIYFGRRGRFFFNAGPVVGYMLGCSINANFNTTDWKDIEGFPQKNRTNDQINMKISNRFDYGICAGLGGEFNITRRNSISLEARFYYGLGNIMPSKRADIFSASNSLTLSLAAGYWFRIK